MSLREQRIGFLGAGAMATALAGGLLKAGVPRAQLAASDPDAARREAFAKALGAATLEDNGALVERSDVVVLAVKPRVVAPLLLELGGAAARGLARPLWISIAAGIPLARLEAGLPAGARVVRAMPNTPALVQAGATGCCANRRAGPEDRAAARALFESVGLVWEAPEEALLDAVTGLSGSGPAFFFLMLEALAEAGAQQGLPPEVALRLASQTALGAARLALESGRAPAELRAQVSSPGGTTLAGLARLEARGFRQAIGEAVAAATARSRELGRGDG
jgi:pyrroline-5-carboxylate reductase